jgi:hypothetical protein
LTGVPGSDAAMMPSSAPIDVPTQVTSSTPDAAISAVSVVRYVGAT